MSALAAASAVTARLAAARVAMPPGALELACHAAVPVAVDPTFVNLLRTNFFLDPPNELPWTVEADLLSSPLFRELGGDLYEIDRDLRRHLLVSLRSRFGVERAVRVALLLERYCDRPGVWGGQPYLAQAQQLTAVSIIDPAAASRWLDEARRDPGAQVELSGDWFVAMRGRLEDQPDPAVRLDDEIRAAIARLSAGDPQALSRLGELALLPGADVAPIRAALLGPAGAPRDDAAAAMLRLLDRYAPAPPAAAPPAGPVPLTELLPPASPKVSMAIGMSFAGRPLHYAMTVNGLLVWVDGSNEPGKRDMLRTLVLALAAAHPPEQLELVLIDAAGGRTFDGLGHLPHVAAFAESLGNRADRRGLIDAVRRWAGPAQPPPWRVVVVTGAGGARVLEGIDHRAAMVIASIPDGRRPERPASPLVITVSGADPGVTTMSVGGRPGAVEFRPATARAVADRLVTEILARHPVPVERIWLPAPTAAPRMTDMLGEPGPGGGPLLGLAGSVERADGPGYEPFWVDFDAGDVAVVGRDRPGRTGVVLSLVLSLALTHTPDEVRFLIADTTGDLEALAALPHVTRYLQPLTTVQLHEPLGDPDRPRTILVVNPPEARPSVHGDVRLLMSAASWGSLDRFQTEIETRLDDPSTSRIDPERAAEVPDGPLDTGLAPGARPFVAALVGVDRDSNLAAARELAEQIAARWTGPTARDRRDSGSPVPSRRRLGLLIGASDYHDSSLPALPSLQTDAFAVADALADPAVGGYEVTMTIDRSGAETRRAIDDMLADCRSYDQVVLYLSGHWLLDERGRLFFATIDTDPLRPIATAIDSTWLVDRLDACRAMHQVVIIDATFAGASRLAGDSFGAFRRMGEDADRVVIIGSRDGWVSRSPFTDALVEGLHTGAADLDGDGAISADELYRYLDQALTQTGGSRPRQFASLRGPLIIARSPTSAGPP